jgi:hypothetical protein
MPPQSPDLFTSFNVPDLDGSIIRASCKNVVVELETHDTIRVAGKDLCGASAVLPIGANLETIFVYILPRSGFPEVVILLDGKTGTLLACDGR